jgi:hypothetical protein
VIELALSGILMFPFELQFQYLEVESNDSGLRSHLSQALALIAARPMPNGVKAKPFLAFARLT